MGEEGFDSLVSGGVAFGNFYDNLLDASGGSTDGGDVELTTQEKTVVGYLYCGATEREG